MKKEEQFGECRICRKYGKLSFEHIPPESAGNNKPLRMYSGDQIMQRLCEENRRPWEYDGLKYKNRQRGTGLYSLCVDCNNITGHYYGKEYTKFSNTFINEYKYIIQHSKENIIYTIEKMKPLLVIKQILSMFCSIHDGFSKTYPIIKDLLLNKNYHTDCKDKFKIYMYLLKNQTISWTGVNVLFFNNFKTKTVVELCVYPFGFVLDLDPKEPIKGMLDITNFLDCKNEDYKCELSLSVKEKNMIFPFDYRSKENIESVIDKVENTND